MGVKIDDEHDIIVVTFAGKLAEDLVGATSKAVNSLVSRKKIKNIVFHMDDCLTADEAVLHEMAEIVQSLSKFDGGGRLVGVNNDVYQTLKETSLDRILLERSNLKTATKDMGYELTDDQLNQLKTMITERVDELKKEIKDSSPEPTEEKTTEKVEKLKKKKQINVQFINHFLLSTTKVLETQFEVKCQPSRPYQKKKKTPMLVGDVCGLISIDSEHFKGTLSISFPEQSFLNLVQQVLGEEETEINDENLDIIGEIANIVLGDAKSKLSKEGYKLNTALPHCVFNKDKSILNGETVSIVIPYSTNVGEMFAEVIAEKDVVEIKDIIGAAA